MSNDIHPPSSLRRFWREGRELILILALALILTTLFRVLAFQPFTIPSSSMEPGLVVGDYVVVSKFAYGWSRSSLPGGHPRAPGRLFGQEPRRGDVVVFRLPRDPAEVWVKRVIGLPGDTVRVRSGIVLVNDRAIPQALVRQTQNHDAPTRPVAEVAERLADGRRYLTYDGGLSEGDDTVSIRVPAGHYFMMGDNRDNSLDSRWPSTQGVGLLPVENIVGRADLILASWRPGASLFKPWTWLNLQLDRFLVPVR